MHHAPQPQDDRLLEPGDVGRQVLVEGVGPVFIGVGRLDGAGLAGLDRFTRPLDIGAPAGGDDVVDGNRGFGNVRYGESAALRTVGDHDVAEVMDDLIQLDDIVHTGLASVRLGLCESRQEAEQHQKCQKLFHIGISFANIDPKLDISNLLAYFCNPLRKTNNN